MKGFVIIILMLCALWLVLSTVDFEDFRLKDGVDWDDVDVSHAVWVSPGVRTSSSAPRPSAPAPAAPATPSSRERDMSARRAPAPDNSSSEAFAEKYAELRAQGKSHKAATELAQIYTGGAVNSGASSRSGFASNSSAPIGGKPTMDTVAVLARYSAEDSHEGARRKQAAEELQYRMRARDLDSDSAMDLLDTIAPGASINERRAAADELERLSHEDWDDGKAEAAAEELTRLITGDHLHARERVEAANELVRRSRDGELDSENAFQLVNTIAPGMSLNARRQAAGELVATFDSPGKWTPQKTKRAAEAGYKVMTGGEAKVEKRMEAGVDLVGKGMKRYGGDSFKDRDIDVSTELIKQTIRGEISTNSVSDLLNLNR